MSQKLIDAIADMQEEEALKLVGEMVESGSEPMAILEAVRKAMDVVGQRYEKGEYYLPELVLGRDRHCLNYTRAYRAGVFNKSNGRG